MKFKRNKYKNAGFLPTEKAIDLLRNLSEDPIAILKSDLDGDLLVPLLAQLDIYPEVGSIEMLLERSNKIVDLYNNSLKGDEYPFIEFLSKLLDKFNIGESVK